MGGSFFLLEQSRLINSAIASIGLHYIATTQNQMPLCAETAVAIRKMRLHPDINQRLLAGTSGARVVIRRLIGLRGARVRLLHSELSQRLQMNRVRTVCDAQAPCQRPPGAKIKFLQRFVIQKRTHQDAKLWSSEPPPAPWSCMESSIML